MRRERTVLAMGFLLEAERGGGIRLLYTDGERVERRDGKTILTYGTMGSFTTVELSDGPGECRITRSALGGNQDVYYLERADKSYVFTSLKLLPRIGFQCRFTGDEKLIAEFIYNGFIRTRDTLVRDVFKLLPNEYLEIAAGKVRTLVSPRIQPAPRGDSELSLARMYEVEKSIFDRYIDFALEKDSRVNIALSGGFDSNLLLHFLAERRIPVRAFCVGGVRGLDETEMAALLCEHNGNAVFCKGEVSREMRGEMRRIAEILEGSLYERGIFLQYVLLKLLRENNVHYILLGECADQVFNRNFYCEKAPAFLTNYVDNPYELGTMVVLKKSVLMLGALGVAGLYPFADVRMQELGAAVMDENGTSKEKQKRMCLACFDDFTRGLVEKNPGSTALKALFQDDSEEADFIKLVQETNEFYNPGFRISHKYGPEESELDYYLCLEYLKAFKQVFCEHEP